MTQHPDGVITWTSPTGRHHTTHPENPFTRHPLVQHAASSFMQADAEPHQAAREVASTPVGGGLTSRARSAISAPRAQPARASSSAVPSSLRR